jgi:hypothetical protein
MTLPVVGYVQQVEVVVGGTLPRAGYVQPVESSGGAGLVTGSGAAGQVTFWTGAQTVSGDASLLWDNTSKILTVDEARFYTPNTDNLFIGKNAGNDTHTGNGFMIGIGQNVLLACTAPANVNGFKATAVGYEALRFNTTGWNCSAYGFHSLYSNTTGSSNAAYGMETLFSNTIGIKNTAIGEDAMYFNLSGNYNVAVGVVAVYSNTTGEFNIGIGQNSLYANQTGNQNVAVGESALALYTGSFSTAVGAYSVAAATSGAQHVGVGLSALGQITTGSRCVSVGYGSGYNSSTPMTTTADSVFIGHSANCSVNALSNVIAIGFQAQAIASNEAVIGNSSLTLVRPTSASSGVATCALGSSVHPWLTLTVGTNPPTAGTVRIGNDGDDGAGSTGAVWKRTAATAREWSWYINSNGQFILRDRTGANNLVICQVDGAVKFTGGVGFNNHATAGQATGGENVTNNVTSGGVDGTIADFTSLTVYATDAATIRNDIYQIARMLKQDHDQLRAVGLLS